MKLILLVTALSAALFYSCNGNERNTAVPESPDAGQVHQDQEEEKQAESKPNVTDRSTANEKKEASEDKVIGLVWQLKEVKELNALVRKNSKNKLGIKTYIASEPGDDQEYYAVAVAEDNGGSLVNHYFIHIYPDFSLRYYDVVQDREMTIEEWRSMP
jgi:hypothetical protein